MFTDFFGQTIAVGDEVVWPIGTYNNPHALRRGSILEIVRLIPHRDTNPGWAKDRYMREDQATKASPTYYGPPASPDKAYILKVESADWRGNKKTTTLRNASSVIKVPAGV